MTDTHVRSRGSGKGKESEYENGESDCPDDEEVCLHTCKISDPHQQYVLFHKQ